MLFIIGVFLFISVVGILVYYARIARIMYLTKDWPGLSYMPIIGHGHHFIGKPPEVIFSTVLDCFHKYGHFKMWLGPELGLFVSDVHDVEKLLSSTKFIEKSGHYDVLNNWLREGLLISKGKKWFDRRKILTPAFHFRILEDFIHVFQKDADILVEKLNTEAKMQKSGGFNLEHWIHLYTLDTICEAAMGVSINALTDADSKYVRAIKDISTVTSKRMSNPFYRFDILFNVSKLANVEKRALSVLHGYSEKIILQRRAELLKTSEKANEKKSDVEDIGIKRKMAFLDILLQSNIDGRPLSNLDIREEVDTFMFEGHDTTGSALTFFFYNIARYPECQRKCVEEIISVMGMDKTKPVTYQELNDLHYIELCIKETLRMYPSVPILARRVTKDCEINGKIIPAGAMLGCAPVAMGTCESLFPDARTFKPERFDEFTDAEKKNPFAYIPFSAGPRNCIGQKFAMLEIKTVVTNLLRNFEFFYAGDPTVEPLITGELILRCKDPLMFKIQQRVY